VVNIERYAQYISFELKNTIELGSCATRQAIFYMEVKDRKRAKFIENISVLGHQIDFVVTKNNPDKYKWS